MSNRRNVDIVVYFPNTIEVKFVQYKNAEINSYILDDLSRLTRIHFFVKDHTGNYTEHSYPSQYVFVTAKS